MGEKMNNAPVFFTLAQIRFNPLPKIGDYIADIQEKLRGAHFADFRQENIQVVSFQSGAVNPNVSPQQVRYVFGNMAETSSFILENSSLSIQTTDYETFAEFSKLIELGVRTLSECVNPGLEFVSRLGIRYLDAVQPEEGEKLSQYLIPEVLGMSERIPQILYSFSETRSQSMHGSLLTRIIVRDGPLGFPVELAQLAPKLKPKFSAHDGRHAVIDSDAFNDKRQSFNLENILANLDGLHDDINNSFKQVSSSHANEKWKKVVL